MSKKIELYKEIHLDNWQDFVKKLMPGEEYHHLLKNCVWRGQRRKDGEKHEDKELRASFFRDQKDFFKAVDVPEQPGKKTYVLNEDTFSGFCIKLFAHRDRFIDYQNLSGKVYLEEQANFIGSIVSEEYIKEYTDTYMHKHSDIDGSWNRQHNLKEWIWLQHYGVKTPLIDWTKFPFYALFFAYHKSGGNTIYREIFALDTEVLELFWFYLHWFRGNFSQELIERFFNIMLPSGAYLRDERANIFNTDMSLTRVIYESVKSSIDNARIIRQGGLFTYTPSGFSIEEWLRRLQRENLYEDMIQSGKDLFRKLHNPILYKIIIPEDPSNREDCLIYLNSMNVNSAMIYPDFEGLANAVNTAGELPDNKICRVRLY